MLSKLTENVVSEQILCLSFSFKLSFLAHIYGALLYVHSSDRYDKWLTCIDSKTVVGIVLLDFSTAFNIIDYGFCCVVVSFNGSFSYPKCLQYSAPGELPCHYSSLYLRMTCLMFWITVVLLFLQIIQLFILHQLVIEIWAMTISGLDLWKKTCLKCSKMQKYSGQGETCHY